MHLWRDRAPTSPLDAIRAWLPRAIKVSSPHPAFANSSGCGAWCRFSCHRRLLRFRQKFRLSLGGVGDEGRLVLDPCIGMAVAELRCAERVERFCVGRYLSYAKCLDVFRDGILIRRSREGRNDAKEPDDKSRQDQLTTIDIHLPPGFSGQRESCTHALFCRAHRTSCHCSMGRHAESPGVGPSISFRNTQHHSMRRRSASTRAAGSRAMSAFGTKRTSPSALHISAFDPKRTLGRPLPSLV